ncbi:MAG: phytanoyl-CoA dioxygenase family protein [Burkholderiaceae bacterium]
MPGLTADEITQYREAGYLVPKLRLSSGQLAAMRTALDELIARNPTGRPEKLVSAHVVAPDGGPNAEGVRGHPAFMELARDPAILDRVADLIGPDILLWGCHVFCKPAGDGLETPWHQDGHYWPIRPLATCTVWVALDPSTKENGCLRVIPGSHRDKVTYGHLREDREDLVLTQRTAPDSFDAETAVDIELEPGQMSMHDVFMIHGANVNDSPLRRTGVALRYMPGTSVLERNLDPTGSGTGIPVQWATRPLWLLRGRDRTGRNDFAAGHPPGTTGH